MRGWEKDIEENDDDSILAYEDSTQNNSTQHNTTHHLPSTANVEFNQSLPVPQTQQPVETWIDVADVEGGDEVVTQFPLQESVSSPSNEHRTVPDSSHAHALHAGTPHVDISLANDTPHTDAQVVRSDDHVLADQPRRSGRTTRQPAWLGDYVTGSEDKKVNGAKKRGRR